ncbi:MAG: porin family protein [Bacteroidota bacterium]
MERPNKNDRMKELFKSAFENFEAEVNDSVWANIKNALHPGSKKRVVWWQWAAAASIIGAVSLYALWPEVTEKEVLVQVEKNTPPAPLLIEGESQRSKNLQYSDEKEAPKNLLTEQTHPPESSQYSTVKDTSGIDAPNKTQIRSIRQIEDIIIKENKDQLTQNEISDQDSQNDLAINEPVSTIIGKSVITGNNIKSSKEDPSNITNQTEAAISLSSEKDILIKENSTADKIAMSPPTPLNVQTIPDLSVNYDLLLAPGEHVPDIQTNDEDKWILAANIQSFEGANSSGNEMGLLDEKSSSPAGGAYSLNALSSTNDPEFSETVYSPPLTLSITFNYTIGRRWSIESGISYTILRSRCETAFVNKEKTEIETTLQYIGVPILLNLRIISGKRISFYSSQGIMIEKGLSSKSSQTKFVNDEITEETEDRSSLKGIQGSAILGLGLDYMINDLFSFYLQPGISAYLINDNHQYNVRNTRRLWPNMQMGIRVHL